MGTMLIIGMGPKKGPKGMNLMEKYLGKKPGAENADPTETNSQQVSFSMPSGFKVPDGVQDGESFDAMATLKLVGGKLVLDELDGLSVSDSRELPEDELQDEVEPDAEASPEEPLSEEPEDSEPAEDSEDSDESDSEELGFLDAIEKKAEKKKPTKKY